MRNLTKGIFFGAAALLVAGQLYADPAGSTAAANIDKKADTGETTKPVELLTPDEMKTTAQSLRDQVRKDIQRVQYLQAQARKAQDVIMLTCVNDKFVDLKAQANIFDQAHQDLLGVLDTDDRLTSYPKVTESASAVHKAREDADTCIGNKEIGTESSDYTSPTLLDDPTMGLPFDIAVEPPAFASPFK